MGSNKLLRSLIVSIASWVLIGSLCFAQKAPSAPSVTSQSNPSAAQKPQTAPASGLDPATGEPLYKTIVEDWSSLQIGNSHLKPLPPLATAPDEQEKFTRQLVQVAWRPGDPIDLWVVLPKGVKKPPVVLYLYNFSEDTDRFRDNGWCERATSGGVAAVGFVSALSGQRFHSRPIKQWFVSELQESLAETVHDVKFILDYLNDRGDVDMSRVGMFGEGSGGAIAILAAAADPRIKAVDTLDPWGDWPVFLAKSPVVKNDPDYKNFSKPAFLKKVAPLDPVKWLPQVKAKVRIQQVHQNEMTPLECKDALKKAAPKQADVVRFENASDLAHMEGRGGLFGWIKERVQEPSKPAAGDTKVASQIVGNTIPSSSSSSARQ